MPRRFDAVVATYSYNKSVLPDMNPIYKEWEILSVKKYIESSCSMCICSHRVEDIIFVKNK